MPTDSVCDECGGTVSPPGCAISATSSIDSEFKYQPTNGNSEPTDTTVKDMFSVYDAEAAISGAPSTDNSELVYYINYNKKTGLFIKSCNGQTSQKKQQK